jgi:hypothetical protein
MPLILIIIGVIAALGLGGYVWETQRNDIIVPEPIPAVVDVVRATPTTEPTPKTEAPTTETPTPLPPTSKPTTPTPVTTTTPVPTEPATTPAVASKTAYSDGTYTETVTYVAPDRGTHPVTVSLTLKNDVITDSSIAFGDEATGATANYQSHFAAAYKTLVIGKALTTIKLSRVAGASLTTNAWNEAQAKITAQAKS